MAKTAMREADEKAAIEANKPFAGLVSSLESTWSGLIARIADGQMTLNSFLRSLFSGTFQAITQTLAQIGLKWVAQRTGLADLETALLGKQRAEEGAAAVASIASKKAEAAAVIPAEAATAAGGAASAVAGIPIVGPALAAEAFAATMAMVMGGLGLASASGGYDIPAGVNPLVQAHAQEMILPAKYADVIRGLADGGGGSGGGGGLTGSTGGGVGPPISSEYRWSTKFAMTPGSRTNLRISSTALSSSPIRFLVTGL